MIFLDNGKKFSYEMIGEFRSNGKWIHPDRSISTYELIFINNGTLYITEENTAFTLHENEMIILEPYKRHFGTKMTSEYVSFYWFHFSTDMPVTVKTASAQDAYDTKLLLKKLLHVANSHTQLHGINDALGFTILNECLSEKKRESALTEEIKEYIRNNLQCVTVSKTASHFGYSPDYIGKLFLKNTGIRLKQYIDKQKLEKAKDMLLTTNQSIKETAAKLGYPDENLFIKFFIYHEKITPKVFASRYFNTHINNR